MRKANILILGSCLLTFVLLSGCTTMYEGHSYKRDSGEVSLDVATLLRFSDVPVPSGFKVLDTESFAFQNDATRVALLKYSGSKPVEVVVSFFKQQMPIYNWSPINIIEYERRILNYEKASESCIITIEPWGRKTIITVALSPKSRPMKVETKGKIISP